MVDQSADKVDERPSLARAVRWGDRTTDLTVFLAIIAVTLVWRLATAEAVEIGGDALKVWEFARQLAHGEPLPHSFSHHTARFGLVLPTLLTQLVWGSSPATYYVVPITASVILHGGVYLLARLLSGRFAGVLAVGALLLFPEMVRPSSQILPEILGPTYTIMASLCAVLYTQASSRRAELVWLVMCGALLFFGFGAKMSYLYFAPGCALIVWKGRARRQDDRPRGSSSLKPADRAALREAKEWRDRARLLVEKLLVLAKRYELKDVALLTATVVGLLIVETVAFWLWGDQAGQVAVASKTHGVSHTATIRQGRDLFALFTQAPRDWELAFALATPAVLGTLALPRDRRATLVSVGLLIYVFLHTFILRSYDPPIPWMGPHPRYLLAMAPHLAFAVGVFVNEALTVAWERAAGGSRGARVVQVTAGFGGTVLVLLFLLGSALEEWEKNWGKRDGIAHTKKTAEQLTDAFRRGIPIISRSPGAKPLMAAGSLYIDPRELIVQGHLPSYKRFQGKMKGGRYLAKAHGQPGADRESIQEEAERLRKKSRCVLTLTHRYRHFRGARKVPEHCSGLASHPGPI